MCCVSWKNIWKDIVNKLLTVVGSRLRICDEAGKDFYFPYIAYLNMCNEYVLVLLIQKISKDIFKKKKKNPACTLHLAFRISHLIFLSLSFLIYKMGLPSHKEFMRKMPYHMVNTHSIKVRFLSLRFLAAKLGSWISCP